MRKGWSKNNVRTRLVLSIALLLTSFGFPASAVPGWRIVATTKSLASPSPPNSTPQIVTTVSQNRVKYETQAWSQIVDLRTQRLAVINHIGQVYWEGSIDEYLSVAAKRGREVRTQRDTLLQRLTPDQRMVIERSSGPFDVSATTLKVTVTPTPEEGTIAGYKAHKYTVLRNSEPYEETWITGEVNLSAEVDMQRLRMFIQQLQESRTTPPGAVLAELTDLVSKGYPVKTVNLLSHITKEVIRAERKDLADEEFAAPKGYAQRTLTEVMSPPRLR